jgi:hypothetical protein
MTAKPLIAAAALAACLAAPAARAADAPRQCFFTRDIQNYRASDDERALYLRVGVNQIYRIDFANQCVGLSFESNHIALQTTPGSVTVCSPIDLDVRVSSHGAGAPCIVKGLHKLTPEEAAALPKTDRP